MGPDYQYYAYWVAFNKSGRCHLTTARNGENGRYDLDIYAACAPEVYWRNGRRLGLSIVDKPGDNKCERCARIEILWMMAQ
jgi:hypothetical protein